MRIKNFSYNRKTKVGVFEGVRFESTYELAFLLKVKEENVVQDICRSTNWISYTKPNGDMGIYNPDFSYTDKESRVVVEIKPSIFLNESSPYGLITRAKIEAAKLYFTRATYLVITEKEIGKEWIIRAKEWYANYQEICSEAENKSR